MAIKKQSEIINSLIAKVKAILLQLNTNTTNIKGKQAILGASALNILSGETFTTAEKTKLTNAITDLSGYTTTAQLTALLNGKQATLGADQLAVINAKPFTQALLNQLTSLATGGRFLGDVIVASATSSADTLTAVNTKFPNKNTGDHVEVIKPHPTSLDTFVYITYTWQSDNTWSIGAEKEIHLKGSSIDAFTKAEANARFALVADLSMDDAPMVALEAITITTR